MKKYISVIAAAVLFAACTQIEEQIPENTDAVPVIGSAEESISLTGKPEDSEIGSEFEPTASETEEPLTDVTEASENTEETTEISAESDGSIKDITLTFYELTLSVGESAMPIVSMEPSDAPDLSEIWESTDESVAEVDWKGNIKGISPGKCDVIVRSAVCPEVYAKVSVTVLEDESQSTGGAEELTYIDGILIANKTYALPKDYNPGVDPDAQAAFDKMAAHAYDEGLTLYISSGFRSYEYQAGLYERYVERSGKAEADRYSARPGHSEHQTGLAFDLNTIDSSFADTDEYAWLKKHCHEYGFIIRYPEDGEAVTGYMYEPWHIRYLGVEIATKVYESGLTLEEYLGIDSKYAE